MAEKSVCKNCGADIPQGMQKCEFCGTPKHMQIAKADPLQKSDRNKQLGKEANGSAPYLPTGKGTEQLEYLWKDGKYSYFQIATPANRASIIFGVLLALASIALLIKPALLLPPHALNDQALTFFIICLYILAPLSINLGVHSFIPGQRSVTTRFLTFLLFAGLYFVASCMIFLPYIKTWSK